MSPMQDPWDDDLARLFEESRPALPGGEFAERVASRIRRARRRRVLWRLLCGLLILAGAAAASPYVARGSLALADRMEEGLPLLGRALVSPAGWAGSFLLALWILRRAKVLGR